MDLRAKLFLMFWSNAWAGELFRQQKSTSMKDYKKGTVHCRCFITLLKEPAVMDEPDFNPEILSFFLKPLLLLLTSFIAPVMFQQHGAQHRLTS